MFNRPTNIYTVDVPLDSLGPGGVYRCIGMLHSYSSYKHPNPLVRLPRF